MVDEVDRLNRAISELLEFARPAELSVHPLEMKGLLEHSLRLVRSDAEQKNVKIELKAESDMPMARVDGDRFIQALLNIYQNSLAAMESGGCLRVSAFHRREGGMVEVQVEDTGSGIPEENIGRIFDPYFTTKKGGTGLGLAIVHKIVESHGGEIRVESRPGQGSRFIILFPAVSESDKQEANNA
jgi:two-component system sensor histidine kinase HydH